MLLHAPEKLAVEQVKPMLAITSSSLSMPSNEMMPAPCGDNARLYDSAIKPLPSVARSVDAITHRQHRAVW